MERDREEAGDNSVKTVQSVQFGAGHLFFEHGAAHKVR